MSSKIDTVKQYEIDKDSTLKVEVSSLGINDINIINHPQFGSVTSKKSHLNYEPNDNFVGDDFFTLKGSNNKEIVLSISVNDTVFKPRARMLLQLGDQLIKNENIALLELVKNSYDANANNVTVLMENVDEKERGIIQIEDNGDGMDINIVINAWMEPGSDSKAKKIEELKNTNETKLEGRVPIGEKGIGRFGVHKLGNVIEMYTKKKGEKEVHVKIDWNDFETHRYLSDVPVEINENNKPVHFKNGKTGTFIHIENLRSDWNRRMVREAYRALGSLTSPFDLSMYDGKKELKKDFFHINDIKSDDFQIHFEIETSKGEDWLEGMTKFDEFSQYSLFSFYSEIEDDSIDVFNYRFTPWDSIKNIEGREIDLDHISVRDMLDLMIKEGRKEKNFTIKNKGIGKIKIRGLVFDLGSNLNPFGLKGTKKSLSDFLKTHGGVKVFRDGMRIYNYGEKDADWLGLDIKRVNSPSTQLSNNLIIIEVHLDRLDSHNLREKTNREGFVENHIYDLFRDAVSHVLNLLAICRNPDKTNLREATGLSPKKEPVLSVIEDTRKFVEFELPEISDKKRKKILFNLSKIETDYKDITEIYLTAAGAGLNMSVVVHEIEKIIKEIQYTLQAEKVSEKAMSLIYHVEKLVDGYTTLIRRSGIKNVNLTKLITDALFNVSYRLKVHKVTIDKKFEKSENIFIKAAPNLMLGAIQNIIDNSIYWTEKSGRPEKKIFINIEKDKTHTHLIIADNGTGFTIPVESITKPFVFGKIGGMGLGLHITNEIITGMKANLLFPDWGDYAIPKEYENGATIVIQFKNTK